MTNYSPFNNPELLNAINMYGWKPNVIQPVSNSVWKITCGDRSYALKYTDVPLEKLLLIHEMLRKIRKSGFPHLLSWEKTYEGSPVVSISNIRWYATPWIEPSKNDKYPPTSFELGKALGLFHRLAQKVVEPFSELKQNVTINNVNKWKEKAIKLSKYKENNLAKEFPSPFDKEFLKCYDKLEKALHFSFRGMEKFIEMDKGISPRYTLCHMRIHSSNIIMNDDNFYFIDFDNVQVETPARDLASLLRRSSLHQGDPDELTEIMVAYESENLLSSKEKKILALLLAYPERIFKILDRYYEQGRSSVDETEMLSRLEEEVLHFSMLQDTIPKLWPSKKANTEQVKKKVAKKRVAKKV